MNAEPARRRAGRGSRAGLAGAFCVIGAFGAIGAREGAMFHFDAMFAGASSDAIVD